MSNRDDFSGYFEQGGALNYRHAPGDYLRGGKSKRAESSARTEYGQPSGRRSATSSSVGDTLFEQDQYHYQDDRRLPSGQRKCMLIFHYQGETCLPQWDYERVKHLRRADESFAMFRERMAVVMDTSGWCDRQKNNGEPERLPKKSAPHSQSYLEFKRWCTNRKADQEV